MDAKSTPRKAVIGRARMFNTHKPTTRRTSVAVVRAWSSVTSSMLRATP